jgi:hypothetical protein
MDKIITIVRKEWAEVFKNKMVLFSVIFLPLLFAALPLIILFSTGGGGDMAGDIPQQIAVMCDPGMSSERMLPGVHRQPVPGPVHAGAADHPGQYRLLFHRGRKDHPQFGALAGHPYHHRRAVGCQEPGRRHPGGLSHPGWISDLRRRRGVAVWLQPGYRSPVGPHVAAGCLAGGTACWRCCRSILPSWFPPE